MKILKNIIWVLLLLPFTIEAQYVLPETIIGKHKDGELFVRWEPTSIEEWRESIDSGYDLTIEKIDGASVSKVHSSKVKVASASDMMNAISNKNDVTKSFYGSSRDVLYPEFAQKLFVEELVDRFIDKTESTLDSFKINMLSYFSIFDNDLAQLNGLGYKWKYPTEGKYRLTLSINNRSIQSIDIDTEIATVDPNINLEPTFGDRRVLFSWDTKKHVGHNFGFYLSKSEDGLKFDRVHELPYIIPTPEPGEEYSGRLGTQDSLDQNYKTYYYNIRGIDFFGHISEKIAKISGEGFEEIQTSPRIINAEQLENNDARLEWDVSLNDFRLIDHFRIMRADSIDGIYEIAVDTISRAKRRLEFPMERETNYFRMESVSAYGQAVSSTPVFIMGMDTIAPATPIVIGATIDTTGQVIVEWNANTESDLWGYKLFKANFDTDEYTLINAAPTMDTMMIDTTHLDLGIDNVYYVLQACDKRNNRSPFTEPIIVEKPDVIPPFKAVVLKLSQKTDSLVIDWSPSQSNDVVFHKVFRRAIEQENKWTLVAVLDTNTVLSSIVEVGLDYGVEYAYTIIATDDANLESEPSLIKSIKLIEPKIEFEPNITTELVFDEELGKVVLKWVCDESENVKSYLIYKGLDPERMTRHLYVEDGSLQLVEDVKKDGPVYYRVCPRYENLKKTYYGDVVSVVIPELEEVKKK